MKEKCVEELVMDLDSEEWDTANLEDEKIHTKWVLVGLHQLIRKAPQLARLYCLGIKPLLK